MATIAEIRQKYPQYNDLSDNELADAFHGRFYSDIPKDQFYQTLGVTTAGPAKPQPKQSGSLLQTIDNAVRGAADTLTFGFADEIAAGADRLFGINTGKQGTAPQNYDEALAAQRARDAEGGGARVVGQLGGAIVPIGTGAQLVKQGLTATKVAPTAMKVAAGTGALTGGAYGVGSAEGDLSDRAVGGVQGATTGAILGPVVQKGFEAGGKVVDLAKNIAGVKTPIAKLSPQVQQTIQEVAPGTTAVSPKAAKALEKLSNNPQSVASDIRVRELFLAEKARVAAADPQRGIVDDEVFKNVGDKLKTKANQTIDALKKAGEIDDTAAKELKAIVSRAARHNRAITGNIRDEELAAELARGFRTDDSIIDGLKLGRDAKRVIKDAVKDLDTVTFNSLKKNQGGIFQNLGGAIGGSVGQVGGVTGSMLGRQIGSGTGRIADKVLLQSGTAPVLKRSVDRLAQGLDEAGVKAGDTVKGLDEIAESALGKLAKKAQVDQKAKDLVTQRLNQQNIALAKARAPYAEGSKLGPNASPQATLVEAFEDATGIKHKPGMVQDVLKAIKADPNFGPAFDKEVDSAIKALGNKPGRIDNLTNLIRAVRAKAAEQQALGKLKIRQGQTVEQGAGRIRNAERYNAKVIENTIRDVMGGQQSRVVNNVDDLMASPKSFPKDFTDIKPTDAVVPSSKLRATQKDLDLKTVDDYVAGRGNMADIPAEVVLDKKTGEYLITDGHHRIAAMIKKGVKDIPVQVVGEK